MIENKFNEEVALIEHRMQILKNNYEKDELTVYFLDRFAQAVAIPTVGLLCLLVEVWIKTFNL